MPALSIFTVDDVANELFGKTDSSALTDEQVIQTEAAITAAETLVCAFLRRALTFAARTEVITVEDETNANPILPVLQTSEPRTVISLLHIPVQATGITVWENDTEQVFNDEHLLVAGTDYQLEGVVSGISPTGIVRRLNSQWPIAPGAVKISYTGGLDAINSPDDWALVQRATLVTIREEFAKLQILSKLNDNGGSGFLTGEDIGDYKQTFDSKATSELLFNSGGRKVVGLPAEAVWILEPLISYGEFI